MDLTAVLLICFVFVFVCVTEPLWGPWKAGSAELKRRERAGAHKAIDGAEERRQTVANALPAAPHQPSPRPRTANMSADVVEAARVVRARPASGETMAEMAADLEIDEWRLDERD